MRSCTKCIEKTKTAPACGCGDKEKWNAAQSKCTKADGEDGEKKTTPAKTTTDSSSANIMKFACVVLVALLALL